mmetsp:Transcript_9268/g.20962  ORF Transcript_9268/g.20962 Transcript_9268/m.20962 type:complete len:147 (-) Transcript_9268:459-899(-)|eukprot:CAMPEP_0172588596 /NCGR_PEP_ID=MMETSP1068-20121228/7473_1 /TAXON_ID=35684 /ORGANISM="Pseudopedinella elastica, Strain CCMP716" /LENGTH=146 /DNA_ID=CAMNT_0013383967 /DNA_START=96 /DNA_END=536 /DNA_ORIENTATION=+
MADAPRKKRTFKKFQFRGMDLDALMALSNEEFQEHVTARQRRRMKRGLGAKFNHLMTRIKKDMKKMADEKLDRCDGVKTHLRSMIIVPEMIGSVVGIYNGKTFNGVQVVPEMVGHYLGDFSITYKPVRHGRPGIGATNSSRFIPLK